MSILDDRLVTRSAIPTTPSSDDELRCAALKCATPAQMASLFDLPAPQVADLLRERLGVVVSRGAAQGHTYTRQDQERFDEEIKGKLYDLVREQYGPERLEQATHRLDWFDTATGQGLEFLGGLIDLEVGHEAYLQKPMRKHDYVMMWAGLIGAAMLAGFTFFILYPVFHVTKRSWERWREAKVDRPTTAIVMGYLTLPITFMVMVPYFAVVLVKHLVRMLRAGTAAPAPVS